MNKSAYVALDIGGTKIMVAAIDDSRNILSRVKVDTPKSLIEGLNLIKKSIYEVTENIKIISIGASAGGPLNHETGVVSPLHFPEWREVPLKKIIEEEFKVPFKVDVDTNAAALAEYKFSSQKIDRLLYVTLSTGLGGGFIVDGEIYRGSNGSHPEVGHQGIPFQLPVSGPIECLCGASNCLEAIVCGTAIKKLYGKPAEKLLDHEWDQVAYNLGQGIRNMCAIYSPTLVILGGGMAIGGGERLINGVKNVLNKNLFIVTNPNIVLSELGYDSALWGAYALALKA